MAMRLIHRGKGQVFAHEEPPFRDATVTLPLRAQEISPKKNPGRHFFRRNPEIARATEPARHYRPGPFESLAEDQCRYVINDENYMMCGAKCLKGTAWCAHHRAIVYR